LQIPAPVMRLAQSTLNIDSMHLLCATTSTPISAVVDHFSEADKFTPPTIKTTDNMPTLRNPPLAPKRQNTRIMFVKKHHESSIFTCLDVRRPSYHIGEMTEAESSRSRTHNEDMASTSLTDSRKVASNRKVNQSSNLEPSRQRSNRSRRINLLEHSPSERRARAN
jgi:hypothetical protein